MKSEHVLKAIQRNGKRGRERKGGIDTGQSIHPIKLLEVQVPQHRSLQRPVVKHDWDLSWNSNEFPEFTLCFEETLLVWIPCLLLWLLSLYELFNIFYKNNAKPIRYTILFIAKMVYIIAHFTGLVDNNESGRDGILLVSGDLLVVQFNDI
ncbi:unnamed protein product [Medioppia subpectinata]|uniref:ABC transporter TMD0 domain-containing protein n=1 Tax=Medioppia subpectinata TaxID=1979941 RepID=A0A7R9KM05_9ACAR|nr:unnamed protein product [Medioppia subpectinata]CAG2106080.1 unnamed protein product [Medioppia subpectinata]